MKGRWGKYLLGGLMVAILAGCSSKPTDRGQQYKDGRLDQSLELVNQPNAKGGTGKCQGLFRSTDGD
jgi:membrane-bound lytic murein transglycosylase A